VLARSRRADGRDAGGDREDGDARPRRDDDAVGARGARHDAHDIAARDGSGGVTLDGQRERRSDNLNGGVMTRLAGRWRCTGATTSAGDTAAAARGERPTDAPPRAMKLSAVERTLVVILVR
jgi:hypothetical protein